MGPAVIIIWTCWRSTVGALIHKGYSGQPTVIPARKALEMATVSAAALGLAGQCGLKAGMKADIILMDREKPHMYRQSTPFGIDIQCQEQ